MMLLAVCVLDSLQNALAEVMALCILRVRIRPFSVLLAACFGAFAALAARVACLSRAASAALWLPVALGMMRIAAGGEGGRLAWLRGAAVLLACEGFLGGVVLSFQGATGSLFAAHLLSTAPALAVFVSARRGRAVATGICRVRVICRIGETLLAFDAIVDSGNSLRDYLTQRPVIVAGAAVEKRLENERFRLIAADTAGGRQLMRLFMPEETTLWMDAGRKRCVRAALAVSPGLGKTAAALVPASLLE